jgi:hypothetical protein
MKPLSPSAASAYRKVDLDARIEAAEGADLTRICIEEAVTSLGQALVALDREPDVVPREALARAHTITVWLARNVSPGNTLREALTRFYGGIAAAIARNLSRASASDLAQARADLLDLLSAARGG